MASTSSPTSIEDDIIIPRQQQQQQQQQNHHQQHEKMLITVPRAWRDIITLDENGFGVVMHSSSRTAAIYLLGNERGGKLIAWVIKHINIFEICAFCGVIVFWCSLFLAIPAAWIVPSTIIMVSTNLMVWFVSIDLKIFRYLLIRSNFFIANLFFAFVSGIATAHILNYDIRGICFIFSTPNGLLSGLMTEAEAHATREKHTLVIVFSNVCVAVALLTCFNLGIVPGQRPVNEVSVFTISITPEYQVPFNAYSWFNESTVGFGVISFALYRDKRESKNALSSAKLLLHGVDDPNGFKY
jgi:hypothetical protein